MAEGVMANDQPFYVFPSFVKS